MAKVSLNKIISKKKLDSVEVTINDQVIEIKQYLPIEEKMAMIGRIMTMVLDDSGIINPARLKIYFNLEFIKTYTNINFTDKMLSEDGPKTFDLLFLNHIIDIVKDNTAQEYEISYKYLVDSVNATEQYLNSFVGMLKTVNQDYSATEMNVEKIMDTLNDPEAVGLLKDVMTKMQ